MAITITPELVVGGMTTVGAVVLALKKSGLITFGKVPERRDCARRCGEHEQVVKEAAMATAEARMTADGLKGDIADIKHDIRRIEEKGDERENKMQEEFRRLRELLGELSGYVKAIHHNHG